MRGARVDVGSSRSWRRALLRRTARSCRAALALAAAGAVLAGCASGQPSVAVRSGGHVGATAAAHGARPAALDPSSGGASGSTVSSGASAPAPANVHTVMRQFAPLDANGELVVSAHPGGFGTCFGTSVAVPVSGVYRCLSGNNILDPCFAPVHEAIPGMVYCFADPWSDGQVVTLTKPLPTYDPDLTEGNPWAVELSNGARCVAVTGAVPSLGDVDLSYSCDTGAMAGLRTAADGSLVAHYGPAAGPLVEVGVPTAWRGRSFRLAG